MGKILKPGTFEIVGDPAQTTPPGRLAPGSFEVLGELGNSGQAVQQLPLAAQGPEISQLESALRGAGQGATMNWGDEIGGFLKSALNPDRLSNSYQLERDQIRAANKAAQEANPKSYLAGELGGSVATAFVPGLNAAKGASVLGMAGKAALQGAIGGLGASESDNVAGLARDTAVGGAVGGILGGSLGWVGKNFVGKAAERAKAPIVKELVQSANGKTRNELVGRSGKLADEVANFVYNDKALRSTYRNPEAFQEAVQSRMQELAPALDSIYEAVDATGAKISTSAVKKAMDFHAAMVDAEARPGLAKVLGSKADEIAQWLGDKKEITASELRNIVRGLQSDTYATGYNVINPAPVKEAMSGMARGMRELLNDHVETTAKKAALDVADVRAANKAYSMLARLDDVAENGARRARAATEIAPFSMKNARLVAGSTGGKLGAAGMLAAVDPTLGIATGAAMFAAPAAARATNNALARLADAAANGATSAVLLKSALEMGIPRATAQVVARELAESNGKFFGDVKDQP